MLKSTSIYIYILSKQIMFPSWPRSIFRDIKKKQLIYILYSSIRAFVFIISEAWLFYSSVAEDLSFRSMKWVAFCLFQERSARLFSNDSLERLIDYPTVYACMRAYTHVCTLKLLSSRARCTRAQTRYRNTICFRRIWRSIIDYAW